MKTRLAVLTLSLVFVLGISGCYTEFATTGGNYGGYGSSYNSGSSADTSQYGYSPTYYDSTGALAINPNYNNDQYGYGTYGMGGYGIGTPWPNYGYGYYGSPYMNYPGWSYSMFVPSAAWWTMEPWYFGFGLGLGYGGPYSYAGLTGWGNWPSYYYSYLGGYYPYNSFYNIYNPYSPYSPYYPWYYTNRSAQPGRVRNTGDTRNGRGEYARGDVPTLPPRGGASSSDIGTSNAASGSSANVGGGSGTRVRATGSENSVRSTGTSNSVNNRQRIRERVPRSVRSPQGNPSYTPASQPRVRERAPNSTPSQGNTGNTNAQPPQRVRERAPSYNPPPQQNSRPQSNRQPQQQPQPRVRERAPSYNPPPQQNSTPPQRSNPQPPPRVRESAPSSPPQQNSSPGRIRHRYMSYNTSNAAGIRTESYRPLTETRVTRERMNYVHPVREVRSYQMPHFREAAPNYGYRAAPMPRMSVARAPAASAPVRSSAPSGGGRTRH